jgi:hypothetical protein
VLVGASLTLYNDKIVTAVSARRYVVGVGKETRYAFN